jgi:hypothetical protein
MLLKYQPAAMKIPRTLWPRHRNAILIEEGMTAAIARHPTEVTSAQPVD